jgi:hypothetical protein
MPPNDKSLTDRLWLLFEHRANDKLTLREKALAYAPYVTTATVSLAVDIKETISKWTGDSKKFDDRIILAECMVALLHTLDRLAFQLLGEEKRNWFFDPLFQEMMERATFGAGDMEAEGKQTFCNLYNARHPYSKLNLIPVPNDRGGYNFSGSMGWALAENIGCGCEPWIAILFGQHLNDQTRRTQIMELLLGYSGYAAYLASLPK